MKATILALAILGTSVRAMAQCPVPQNYVYLHANQIRAAIPSAVELFTVDEDGARFLIGKTPAVQRSSVYNSGIWLSGIAPNGEIRTALQTNTFAPFTHYTAGPISPAPVNPEYCNSWDKVWSVTKQEIDAHIRDFIEDGVIDQPIPSIFSWPGNKNPGFLKWNGFELPDGLSAPFWDDDNNGVYNPETGDFPFLAHLATPPDQLTWSVFNDRYSSSRPAKEALNMQVERSTWAYHCPDNKILDQSIFVRYVVTNKGSEKIDSCFFGLYTDFDLGCTMDDFAGTSVRHNAIYVYNATNEDQTCGNAYSFQKNPPVQALVYLNKPMFASFFPGRGRIDAVDSPKEAYLFLNGLFNDGVPQTASGLGYKTNGPVTKYSYTGDPNTAGSWSMFQENFFGTDVNLISSVYLGNVAPGASTTIDVAYVYVREEGNNHLQNIQAMYAQLDSIQRWYPAGIRNVCTQEMDYCTADCVWPGDANNDGIVNNQDLLAIGHHFRLTGPSRNGIINWGPKKVVDWPKAGQKHVDTNGNGFIDRTDADILLMHYNLQRPDYVPGPDVYPVGPELRVVPVLPNDFINVEPGQGKYARIALAAVPELNGLAFSLEYDPRYFSSIAPYNPTQSNLEVGFAGKKQHQLDVAHYNISTTASIPASNAFYTFEIRPRRVFPAGLQGDSTWLRFKNITGVKKDGTKIPIGGTDFLVVFKKDVVSADPDQELLQVEVFPNPASEQVTVQFPGSQFDQVQLFTFTGVLVSSRKNVVDQVDLDVRAFAPGIYFLKIEKQGYSTVRKVIIE